MATSAPPEMTLGISAFVVGAGLSVTASRNSGDLGSPAACESGSSQPVADSGFQRSGLEDEKHQTSAMLACRRRPQLS